MREKLSPKENRRAWLAAFAMVALMAMAALLILFPSGRHEIIRLPAEGPLLREASATLDTITIDAVFDPESRTLSATQVMTLHNPAGIALDQVTLRSYAGAYLLEDTSPVAVDELHLASYGQGFSPGGLTLESAQVNGQPVTPLWEDAAHTVLTLPADWPGDGNLTVTLTYLVTIPRCASRFGETEGVWALGNVFPTLALWQDGDWRKDAYIAIGDPFLTACANWTVRLTLPKGYQAAATCYAEPVLLGDQAVYTMQASAVRDFALVISDQFQQASGMADDVLVTAYARNASAARRMVQYAKQAIACYEAHYGPYAYPTLTLAEVDFPYGGMEYPRMVMIGSSVIAARDDSLEVTVAHETAHQWWYAMVGSDSWMQAWQDESLCEYALMDYIGSVYGAQARESAAFDRIETALRITVPRGVTPGSPIDYFQDLSEYSTVVYRRGAALWMALETHMGKDALDSALQTYQNAYRFSMATRQQLTDILSDAAGHDLSPLMEDYLDTYITN